MHLNWPKLRYHEQQSNAWRSKKRFVALACGRGSGKTELARRRVVRFLPIKKNWPNPIYFYALPTIAQARRVAWKPILDLIPKDWIKEVNKTDLRIDTVFGSTLYIVGADKPQRLEGVQWDGGIIDESSDQRPGFFDLTLLPALSHKSGWVWRIGVPKRFGIGAKEFKTFFERGLSGDNQIDSFSWKSEEIIPKEEIERAKALLDEVDYLEQYCAVFQSGSGMVFHAYDEILNVSENAEYNPNKYIVVGSDFNVDPMCWILAHIDMANNTIHVFDEIVKRNTNTQRTLDALHAKYGQHKAGWFFIGDATGQARKTSAAMSDYLQILNDTRFENKRVYYPKSNPNVLNRFASCNAMLCNANGDRRLFIHPRCKTLQIDLDNRAYKPGTREVNDYGDIGHITDALGYVVHVLFPINHKLKAHKPDILITSD